MKAFLSKGFKLLALFVVIYVVALLFLGFVRFPQGYFSNVRNTTGDEGNFLTRLREADSVSNVDVLILGSSHAYRGFDPRIFKRHSLNAFNLGSSQQTPIQTEILVREYIQRMNPKAIILEIFPITFSMEGNEAAVDFISNHALDWNAVQMMAKVRTPMVFNSFLYTAGLRMRTPLAKTNEETSTKRDRYIKGGFVEKLSYQQPDFSSPLKQSKIVMLDEQIESLITMLNIFERRQVKVYLVQTPLSDFFRNSITNSAELDERFKEIAGRYRDVRYVNGSDFFKGADDTLFYDAHHMNQKGVELFDEHIIGTFLTNGK
jgi:hypothetical protein